MKKKLGNIAMTMLAIASINAQTTQVDRWVNTSGGNSIVSGSRSEENVKGLIEDGKNNTYVIGNYTGSMTFTVFTAGTDGVAILPSSSQTLNSLSGSQDVYLARYDINGKCTWLTSIGTAGFDEGNAIAMTNPSSPSDFYVTGMMGTDAFIRKYTAGFTVTPVLSWSQSFGGGAPETCGMGIVVNNTNVFITGYFTDFCLDINGDPILQKTNNSGIQGQSFNTTTSGWREFPSRDMFVARFAATNGAFSDALNTYRSDDQVEGHGIALYGTDLFVTGCYKGTSYFQTTSVPCSGQRDVFVAKYPQAFYTPSNLSLAATAAATAGGPTTLYQAASTMPFDKQDDAFGICATNYGIFITGRFMDKITFGSLPTIDPTGLAKETYMFLARYDVNLTTNATSPKVVTGSGGYSEGRGIYGINGSISNPVSTIFVTGGAVSTASINSTAIENNGYAAEGVGFIARIGYSNASSSFAPNVNNFVDGITQNNNGLDGTSGPWGGQDAIETMGYATCYRTGCGVRIGGKFAYKKSFGNIIKTATGLNDAFLLVRENSVSVSLNKMTCGPTSVVLNGIGGTSPLWTGPSLSSPTTSVTVTPTITTTYTFSAAFGTCPVSLSPVTIYNYSSSSSTNAGPDKSLCGTPTFTVIGGPAINNITYGWAPVAKISGSYSVPNPTTTTLSSTVEYTMTATDKCGTTTQDKMIVSYASICSGSGCVGCGRTTGSTQQVEIDKNNTFTIFPSPNNGLFAINTLNENSKDVFVYDMVGKLVYSNLSTLEQTLKIDLTNLPNGLYIVKMVSDGTIYSQKIVKQD